MLERPERLTHLAEFASVLLSSKDTVQQELSERVVELFEGIRHFELPGEIIDLQIASELIIDFLLARFGSRGKIARLVLDSAPVPSEWAGKKGKGISTAMQVLSYQIGELWRGTPLDPNKYWVDLVLPIIAKKFGEVRDDLVGGMYGVLGEVLEAMGIPRLTPPAQSSLPETEVVPDTLLPEGDASASQGTLFPTGPAAFAESGGSALNRGQRARFEPALGADLSHVRVHPAAPQATSAVGADAMTSGSHVYLSPGISPASSNGTRLLAHELTHVVQQTGATGAGQPGQRAPAPGRAGLGIRRDPARESIAERISSRVASGASVSPGLRGEIGTATGAQPAMAESVVEGVLEVLTARVKPGEFERNLEGGDPPGWSDAKRLVDAVAHRLKSVDRVKFAAFLKDSVVSAEVLKYFGNLTNPFNDVTMKRVAMLGQKPIKKKTEDAPDTEFEPKRFIQLLADHLFAETHIATKIALTVDLKDVSEVEIFNIDLASIGGGAGLWRLAMKASFEGNAAVPDLARAQREIRQRLSSLQAQPSLWDSSQFRFASWLIDDYVAQVKARSAANVDDVPEAAKYVETKSSLGHGLAIGTHKELTASTRSISKFGRESHHTTQYLLIEFFSNHKDSSQKAFPEPIKDFDGAGVTFNAKGEIDEIRGPGGGIRVADLSPDSGRGSAMPAILLSERCHQRGELHVLRESRWVDNSQHDLEIKGTLTQGLAIENAFNKAIAEPALRPRETSKERREALRARIAENPVKASQQYYSAALATYRWMHDRMIPALKRGLLTEEKAYYRGVAAQKHAAGADGDTLQTGWDLKDHQLTHVFDLAVKNNDDVMRGYNWKL